MVPLLVGIGGTSAEVIVPMPSLGMVNGTPGFDGHPAVIDGYAELMTEVFGEEGWGARSAVGMGSLPLGISVEIEAIFVRPPFGATTFPILLLAAGGGCAAGADGAASSAF